MPELFSSTLFTQETERKIREAEKQGDNSSNTKAQILRDDENYVGHGGRVVVAATEQNPDKLVAISMKEVFPKEAKTVFYNHKILKILFPYNFPKIFATGGKHQGKGVSANFRERVYGRKFTKKEANDVHSHRNVSSTEHPFSKVIDIFEKLGIPILFDRNERNYMVSDYDDEIFVDTINYNNWSEEQKDAVINYIEAEGYSKRDVRVVKSCFERLMIINSKINL